MIVAKNLSGLLATCFGIVFAYSIYIGTNPEYYAILALFFAVVYAILKSIVEINCDVKYTEQIQGHSGEIFQMATYQSIKEELEETSEDYVKESLEYFTVAQRDFFNGNYSYAITNYTKSIKAMPSMAAYLNKSVSQLYLSNFRLAHEDLIGGIQIARKKNNRIFESSFISNMAISYNELGNVQEALECLYQALKIYKDDNILQGQAIILNNLANLHIWQGQFNDAEDEIKKDRKSVV